MENNLVVRGSIRLSAKSKNTFLGILIFLIPILITFQPFFPGLLQSLIVWGRLLIVPVIIFFYLKPEINFNHTLLFLAYTLLVTILSPPPVFTQAYLDFFTLFASIAFFKFGYFIKQKKNNDSIVICLSYGVTFVNIATIVIFYLIGLGKIDFLKFAELTQKEIDVGLFRFSIGNAIESPLILTCLLYTAILLLDGRKSFLFSTSVNLFTAIMAQSRIVLLIAAFLFFKEFFRSKLQIKVLVILIVSFSSSFFLDEFGDIFESILNRTQTSDDGSANERKLLLDIFINNFSFLKLIFGDGLYSSYTLIKYYYGIYRSIESLFLQLVWEIGIIGSILFLMACSKNKKYFLIPKNLNIPMLLIYVQILFFLQIFTLLPIVFCLFGVHSMPISIKSKLI